MKAPDARRVALDVLTRIADGAASDRALDRALREARLEARERGLATELVYGVLRRRRSLDGLLAPHSKRPLEQLDAVVLEALRLGVYQLRHLDRVPAHAAVDATVEAVKARQPAASGFVNAVLRALQRAGDAVSGAPDDPFADAPSWWAERLRDRWGETAAADWLAATLAPTPLTLRPHPRVMPAAELGAALAAEGVTVEPAAHAPGALRVTAGNPLASPLLRAGGFTVRGEAGQLVASLLPVPRGARVLDACAGRGGKALQLAEEHAPALLVAADVSRWRTAACRRAAATAGLDEVHPLVADFSVPAPLAARFDAVLVDAPCSGLGTVRRRPELKWRNTPERIERLAVLQRAILGNAAATLRPRGALLYATCSTEPEENEQVVEAVLEQLPGLQRRPVTLPAGVDPAFVGDDGCFRTYPRFPELDGFFAALLVRTG